MLGELLGLLDMTEDTLREGDAVGVDDGEAPIQQGTATVPNSWSLHH
jgi:hypothetical protein